MTGGISPSLLAASVNRRLHEFWSVNRVIAARARVAQFWRVPHERRGPP